MEVEVEEVDLVVWEVIGRGGDGMVVEGEGVGLEVVVVLVMVVELVEVMWKIG